MMLSVENLTVYFEAQCAVEDISFQLAAGETLGIVGESGSGKTATALSVAGLIRRRTNDLAGRILFAGQDMLSADEQVLRPIRGKEIGMVFQEPKSSLNPLRRIGWQVEESLRIHNKKLSRTERRAHVFAALEAALLTNPARVARQYPHELSGGMRQRVMLAAALMQNPKLLICDEPTTALDAATEMQILELLQARNREHGTAILFISHNLHVVRKLCNRVIVMQNGKIAEQADTEALFTNPQAAYTKTLLAAGDMDEKGGMPLV